MEVAVTLNGREVLMEVEPQDLLLDVLRETLGLTGAKRSCEVQVCGTCTVLLDGAPVSACTLLAADTDGRAILTIEGLRDLDAFPTINDAFERHAAVQCGFCSPAMALTIHSLLESADLVDEASIRDGLSGNLCRCTGYRGIIAAAAELAGIAASDAATATHRGEVAG
jgi:aerobic-type carbon monoxide dehydrogenase small subunit (CoxS/CutS family)